MFALQAYAQAPLPPKPKTEPFLVVIDPGHGGEDQGTLYQEGKSKLAEKDLTLLLSLQVAESLKKQGIAVKLTRTSDTSVPLQDRTALANELKAKLFISIHLNSVNAQKKRPTLSLTQSAYAKEPSVRDTAEGVETYILNHTTQESSIRLARLENSVLKGSSEKDRISVSQAHSLNQFPNESLSEVALILKDLRLDANRPQSQRLACLLQKELVLARQKTHGATLTPGVDRGVKQGLFYVLLGADMPSALVEAGFLSNANDRQLLLSSNGQKRFSDAITTAVLEFKKSSTASPSELKSQKRINTCKVL